MAPNEDLNKIREAARRLQEQGGATPPPTAPNPPSPTPPPPARPRYVAPPPVPPQRVSSPPEDGPPPYTPPATVAGSGSRLRAAVWGVPTSLIVLWMLGVARFTIGDGDRTASGTAVGRTVGALGGRLFLAVALLAIVAALILGRLGVWLSAILSGVAGFSPMLVPDLIVEPSLRWTPEWLIQGCAETSALPGEYLRWVAFLAAPVMLIFCLVKALSRR